MRCSRRPEWARPQRYQPAPSPVTHPCRKDTLHQPPHNLRDFDIDEVRCVQTFRRMQGPSSDALRPRRL